MGSQSRSISPSYGTRGLEGQDGPSETAPLLQNEGGNLVEDDGNESATTTDSEVQEGVRKFEAISKAWTQRSLIIAYIGYVD